MIHYSQPRYTKALDIWVQPNAENAEKLIKAFAAFGVSTFGLSQSDFEVEGTQLSVGMPPVAIDFLTSLPGLEFDAAWRNREVSDSENGPIYYLSKNDLVTAKKFAGRAVDLAELENGEIGEI